MLKIHKQTAAESDLIDTWLYTFQNWGEAQADKYLDKLAQAIELIADHPEIGLESSHIRPGYYKYHINKHLIFYYISGSTVHIVRILGDEMDYEQHL